MKNVPHDCASVGYHARTVTAMHAMDPNIGARTNPSIFLRLNAADAQPRELAWDEFNLRYVPDHRQLRTPIWQQAAGHR